MWSLAGHYYANCWQESSPLRGRILGMWWDQHLLSSLLSCFSRVKKGSVKFKWDTSHMHLACSLRQACVNMEWDGFMLCCSCNSEVWAGFTFRDQVQPSTPNICRRVSMLKHGTWVWQIIILMVPKQNEISLDDAAYKTLFHIGFYNHSILLICGCFWSSQQPNKALYNDDKRSFSSVTGEKGISLLNKMVHKLWLFFSSSK